jgi:hypothetical protein
VRTLRRSPMSRIECNGAAGDRDPVQNIVDWTRPVTRVKGPVLAPVTERPSVPWITALASPVSSLCSPVANAR